jgi:hypothetical protein
MRPAIRHAIGTVLVTIGLTACAATPLPPVKALHGQDAARLAWDAQTCAWTAGDASSYWSDLSEAENAIVDLFALTWTEGASPEHLDVVTTMPAATLRRADAKPATGSVITPAPGSMPIAPGGATSEVTRAREGRIAYQRMYHRCMSRRGYEPETPAQEGQIR